MDEAQAFQQMMRFIRATGRALDCEFEQDRVTITNTANFDAVGEVLLDGWRPAYGRHRSSERIYCEAPTLDDAWRQFCEAWPEASKA